MAQTACWPTCPAGSVAAGQGGGGRGGCEAFWDPKELRVRNSVNRASELTAPQVALGDVTTVNRTNARDRDPATPRLSPHTWPPPEPALSPPPNPPATTLTTFLLPVSPHQGHGPRGPEPGSSLQNLPGLLSPSAQKPKSSPRPQGHAGPAVSSLPLSPCLVPSPSAVTLASRCSSTTSSMALPQGLGTCCSLHPTPTPTPSPPSSLSPSCLSREAPLFPHPVLRISQSNTRPLLPWSGR